MTDTHVSLTLWEHDLVWATSTPLAYADPHVPGSSDVTYEARSWESPVVTPAFAARELIPSWNARTPAGTWLLVELRVASDAAAQDWSPWLTLARWADADIAGGAPITRTTVRGQQVQAGHVATDRFVAAPTSTLRSWQVRLTGLRAPGAPDWPEVDLVAVASSAIRVLPGAPTSTTTVSAGLEIAVPPHSQRLHVGTFPQWDDGGESWCSPTSTTMLLEHWGRSPSVAETAWVGHDLDPAVVHAVRRVYDEEFRGAGNWAFNTAYAGTRGLRAYVTRLRDLTEAERFVEAGVPLVVSATFQRTELDGAGYDTNGHLLTIVGFTAEGDVVSNDPNSHTVASNDQVRTVYRRDQFERVWLGDDGGLAYVMAPPDVPLPQAPPEANWR